MPVFVAVKYPIIPSFHHWRFPHGNLPPLWRNLQLSEFTPTHPTLKGPAAAMERDITCRLSGYMDGVEKAHLAPEVEKLWFVSNRMDRYCRRALGVAAINDNKNIFILRQDLHHLFDARCFVFVPKHFGGPEPESAQLVTHVLLPSGSPEFVGLYHNRLPQPIRGISIECLFTRFAWSLFTGECIPFFQLGLQYAVRLWDPARAEPRDQTLEGPDVKSPSRVLAFKRSVGPPKKSLSAQGDQDDGGDGYWSDDGESVGEQDSEIWNEPQRGRSRKRRWDTFKHDELPSLTGSFASGQGRQASQPPTPIEGGDAAMPPALVGETTGSRNALKRIHIEDKTAES